MIAKVVDQMCRRAWQQGERGSSNKQKAENHEKLIAGIARCRSCLT
jgi:hypothetical protein